MRTLVLDPASAGLTPLLERRRRRGLDRGDEVWEGVLHVNPTGSHAHASVIQQLAELLGPAARAAGLEPTLEFNIGVEDTIASPMAAFTGHRRRRCGTRPRRSWSRSSLRATRRGRSSASTRRMRSTRF